MTSPESGSNSPQQHSYRLTSNLADELSLSEDQLVRANVVSRLPDESEKIIVNIRGRKVVARSKLNVEENQTLLVRVVSLGSPIELRLIDPYDAPEELTDKDLETFLDQHNLSSSEEDVEFFREWLDQSLPLKEDLLQEAFKNEELVRQDDGSVDGNRLWAMVFLIDDKFPITPDLVDLLGEAKDSNVGNDLAMLHRSPGSKFRFNSGDVSVRDAVQSIGFDVVRQFSRKPHQASQTLHSMLLKALRGEDSTGNNPLGGTQKRLLGLILGVAMMNLRTRTGFRVFYPVVDDGNVRLVWLKGYTSKESGNWSVNCQVRLSRLGRLSASVESTDDGLSVVIRSDRGSIVKSLKRHAGKLTSSLQTSFEDVTVKIVNESPGTAPDPFAGSVAGADGSKLSFTPGLDVTA